MCSKIRDIRRHLGTGGGCIWRGKLGAGQGGNRNGGVQGAIIALLYLSRESGKPVRVRDGWRSAVLAQYRRQAACLTARLGNLGEGARQAACRRGKVL